MTQALMKRGRTSWTAQTTAFLHTAFPLHRDRRPLAKCQVAGSHSSFVRTDSRSVLFQPAALQSPGTSRTVFTPSAVIPSGAAVSAALSSSAAQIASTGAGILLLGGIVFIHECGHFFAARWQGIKVKNFSVGFGPTLFSVTPKGSNTEFTLRALPLGGYVAFPENTYKDEETDVEIVDDDPDLLQNRPVLDRAIVVSAGVIANLILAWAAIFSSVTVVGVPKYDVQAGVVIAALVDDKGAGAAAGVRPGDVILSIDHQPVPNTMESAGLVASKIRSSGGRPMDFRFSRNGKQFDKQIQPKCCSPTGDASMGVQLVPNANITRVRPDGISQTLSQTNKEVFRLGRQTGAGLMHIVTNFRESSSTVSGPIGVVAMGANLASNEKASLFTFCAVVSLNLALINALPLPALDGGQMVFLIVEQLKGSPISMRVQDVINRTALIMFLAFSGVLLFNDIEKLSLVSALSQMFG